MNREFFTSLLKFVIIAQRAPKVRFFVIIVYFACTSPVVFWSF